MSYCVLADIEKKRIPTDTLIQLTDDGNLGVIDEDMVNGCIQDATVLVEGYLRGRYTLPLSPVPDLAVTITADLAVYGIYATKPQFDIPKSVQDRRDTALNLLARIQDGRMPLFDTVPDATPTSNRVVSFSGPERIMSRDTLKDF
jgi:phage gp36-like protein